MSLRKKLTITILTCIIITGISAAAGFQVVLRRYNRSLYNQSANLNSLYFSVLSDELSRLVSSGGTIATDQRVQTLLLREKTGGMPLDEARHYLSQAVTNKITGIFLYDTEEMRVALGNTGVRHEILSGFVLKVMAEDGESWTSAGTRDGSLLMGRKILSAQPGSFMKPIGALVLRINLREVLRSRRGASSPWDETGYIALYYDDTQVYPAGEGVQAAEMPEIASGQYRILTLNDQAYFVTMNVLQEGHETWRMYFGLPYVETMGQIALSRRIVLVTILTACLLAFAVTALVMRRFTQNYALLVGKMDRFRRGEYHPEAVEAGHTGDELISLNQTFDRMAADYDRVTRENYEKQLLLMQARLKNLEQQLDPHFLYNTLETINYFAKRSGEENIPKIVTSLAELLQYSLGGKGDRVTLRQETEMLDRYLYIQQVRFSDILRVEYAYDAGTLAASIPKMTLQPLVENAIRYTLEEEESCELRIASVQDGGDVLITVSDNGPPMEADLLEKLRSGEKKPHGNGIGLMNVDMRHKLLFGERYGLTFGDMDGRAAVTVRIPAERKRKGEGAPDVQDGDR